MRRELDGFLALVEAHEQRPAVLYVTPVFLTAYQTFLPNRPVWRRAILSTPRDRPRWAIWQYYNRGKVAGIRGPVDLNVFHADQAAFDRVRGVDQGAIVEN